MLYVTDVPADPPYPSTWRGRRARRRAAAERFEVARELADTWRWTAEGTAVARTAPCVAGGVVVSVPHVVAVDLGPPVRLTVRLLPGQLVEDLAAVAERLAEGLAVAALRVERARHHGHATVTLLRADPLAATDNGPRPAPGVSTLLGHDETGRPVELDWTGAAHLVVQGATRSGKSTALYGVLGQLAAAPHVQVTGCDPTGLLLGPWQARGGPFPPSTGTGNPAGHVAVLERLTGEMDRRISAIPPGRDTVDLGPDHPLMIVCLEEWPGLLRVLDGADRKLGQLARAAVARLLAEGAKAGLRVVMVTQRAEANIIGGFERGQASHALSFRVAGRESVALLHPDVPAELVAAHATAPPGVALLSAPGERLRRIRAPHTTYAAYVAAVRGETP